MYIPTHFEEPRVEVMHDLMRAHPLATLVTLGADGIEANHIPLHLTTEPAPFGILRGHVARANPLWRDVSGEVLAIFHGPQGYISPSWYATKKQHGKVATTWNYIAVHAYGELRVVDDPAWLRNQVAALTDEHEGKLPAPWAVGDAPAEFTESLLQFIVGIEIRISRLQGKWKMSQNQPPENRESVALELSARGVADMADLVRNGK